MNQYFSGLPDPCYRSRANFLKKLELKGVPGHGYKFDRCENDSTGIFTSYLYKNAHNWAPAKKKCVKMAKNC
jgi:hypothetical protein